MATLDQDANGIWRIRFRVAGKHAYRSLQTKSEKTARAAQASVEDTLMQLKLGRLEIPHDVDPVLWVLGGGRLDRASPDSSWTLSHAVEQYFLSIPDGSKEDNTIETERLHTKHLQRVLGKGKQLRSLKITDLQQYVATRSRESGSRGRKVAPYTIKKELMTFGQIWRHAKNAQAVSHDLDRKSIKLPKSRSQPKFQTWDQIESQITSQTTDQQRRDLWECLFMRESEILDFLEFMRTKTIDTPWVYPALAFAAFTGARQSEVRRATVTDIDFDRRQVQIREKKRIQDVEISYRFVCLHSRLETILRKWLAEHPGGVMLFTHPNKAPLTKHQTVHYFRHNTAGSKWSVVQGWHVLRHSFASICASKGIRERTISEWMGHETEEMKARYQHLFPEDTAREMSLLFRDV